MFESLEYQYLEPIYLGLKCLFEKKEYWGTVFHNHDSGHPVYLAGASNDTDNWDYADSPERNRLYKMLKELSDLLRAEMESTRSIWWYDFKDWQSFCKYAVEKYNEDKN